MTNELTIIISKARGNDLRFVKYLSIGIIATLLDWAIYYLLIGQLDVYYPVALAVSYLTSTAFSFFLNRTITFQSRYGKVHVQFASFLTVAVIGLGLNEAIVYLLARFILGPSTLALMASRVIATVIVFISNYELNKRITFNVFR